MIWRIKTFDNLNTIELYELLALRQEVFVVEQNCPYLDADGKDQFSWHVLGFDNNILVAYARIVQAGISYNEIAVGRVIVKETHRSKKLGYKLMEKCHEFIESNLGKQTIKLSAQSHLKHFYENLHYISTGKEYLEDNIPHTEMTYNFPE